MTPLQVQVWRKMMRSMLQKLPNNSWPPSTQRSDYSYTYIHIEKYFYLQICTTYNVIVKIFLLHLLKLFKSPMRELFVGNLLRFVNIVPNLLHLQTSKLYRYYPLMITLTIFFTFTSPIRLSIDQNGIFTSLMAIALKAIFF